MNIFQVSYILLRKDDLDQKITEYVVAPNIGAVWKYYKESIAQDNIEFEGIFKVAPVIRILADANEAVKDLEEKPRASNSQKI